MPTATEATAAIAEYSPTEAALAELRTKYADTAFDLASTAGNKAARAARLELVTLRTSLERKRKELKAPALEYAKRIDTEARRITDEILSLETPIDEQIKADEARCGGPAICPECAREQAQLLAAPQPEQHCAHERFGVAGNVFDSRGVARPYGTDTMSEMGIVPMCDEPERQPVSEPRSCTCHPDDNPPVPCAQKYALSECRAASEPTEVQIEAATDAWQAHCGLLLLSREGARDEVLIVLRAALAAKQEK